jgi:hypothetical protein
MPSTRPMLILLVSALAALGAGGAMSRVRAAGQAPAGTAAGDPRDRPNSNVPAFWAEPPLQRPVQWKPEKPEKPVKPAKSSPPPQRGVSPQFVFRRPPTAPDDVPAPRPAWLLLSRVMRAQEVAEACSQAAGVRVVIQGDWARSLVAVPQRPVEAAAEVRQVMVGLEASFPGRWWKLGPDWVLARSRAEAELSAIPRAERLRRVREELGRLLVSLPPEARARLDAGEELGLRHLRPPAPQALGAAIRLSYYQPDWEDPRGRDVPSEGVLRGDVLVAVIGAGREAALRLRDSAGAYEARFPLYGPAGERLLAPP